MQLGESIKGMKLKSIAPKQERQEMVEGIVEVTKDDKYTFECICGNTKEFWGTEFPKDRKGREELLVDCGCGEYEATLKGVPEYLNNSLAKGYAIPAYRGRPKGQRKFMAHFSLTAETIDKIHAFAQEKNIPISHAVEIMLKLGLQVSK